MARPPSNLDAQATAQASAAHTRAQKKALAAIVALLVAGAVGYGLLLGIRGILQSLGLTYELASFLADFASTKLNFPDLGLGDIGPMQKLEMRHAFVWRAIYILAAAERLQEAQKSGKLEHAMRLERMYFAQHVAAEERRLRAAALVDVTSRLLGDRTEEQTSPNVPLLGWRSVIDNRTTPECRWANLQNFRADRMPVIGLPGAVHPRCRCTVGPATKGAPILPSV